MWITDSIWFEIAIVSMIYAIGNIFLGHFEEQTPKIKRLSKYILTLAVVVGLQYFFGRIVALTALGFSLVPALYLHLFLLPKKGINGWTGEPRDKYYEFRGWDKKNLQRRQGGKEITGSVSSS